MNELHPDTIRLNWLNENLYNRENVNLMGRLDPTHNMWVMFAPKGVQGTVRNIIDSAIEYENENLRKRARELSKIFNRED